MYQSTKKEMHDLFRMVWEHNVTIEEADAHAEAIVMELTGQDESIEGTENGFPEKWSDADRISVKKTWVHSRNHLRRNIRAQYKGYGGTV